MGIFNLSAKDRLIRARVQLTFSHPFFARLTMTLKFVHEDGVGTMGVNKYGVCFYNEDFVNSLSEEQLKGTLAHEVMHCALDHLNRGEKKEHQIYNVSADLCINDMLTQNGLQLPDKALIPDHNHAFELPIGQGKKHRIERINERHADEIYNELYNVWKQNQNKNGQGGGSGQGGIQQGHDKHKYGDGQGKGQQQVNKDVAHRDADYWKNKVVESYMAGKMAGKTPAGMERVVDDITNPKMSWQQMLQRFVRNRIPYDFTWRNPSKKTYSTGWYMPKTKKEGVTITLLIDTSGSVGQKEIGQIFGELKGIVGQVHGLKLRILYHDTKVYEGSTLTNPTLADVHKELKKLKGGGGTDFEEAYKFVEDARDDVDMVIHATDGYDRFPKSFKYPLIVCLTGNSKSVDQVKDECPYAKVIKVEDK